MNGTLASVIVAIIIAAVVILDLRYIVKKKKQGTCIGCPESGNGKCSCHCHD